MRELIILCGVTHSGKTSYAKELIRRNPLKQFRYVSTKALRKVLHGNYEIKHYDERSVWNHFHAAKQSAFRENANIILDACHITKKARADAIRNLPAHYKAICIFFDIAEKELKNRIRKTRRVSIEYLKGMLRSLIAPDIAEGFHQIDIKG